MHTKLTLRLDEALIASAKDYAAAHGSSVSQIVANYFAALTQKSAQATPVDAAAPAASGNDNAPPIGPITRRLTGMLKTQPGQQTVDEDDYHAYLERKYLGEEHPTGSPHTR